jgi:hypothetical protein
MFYTFTFCVLLRCVLLRFVSTLFIIPILFCTNTSQISEMPGTLHTYFKYFSKCSSYFYFCLKRTLLFCLSISLLNAFLLFLLLTQTIPVNNAYQNNITSKISQCRCYKGFLSILHIYWAMLYTSTKKGLSRQKRSDCVCPPPVPRLMLMMEGEPKKVWKLRDFSV